MGLSSASLAINMGGIATLAYDSGTGGYGANAVDNIVPTAWEEIDYGFSTGINDVGAISKSKGLLNLTVKAPVAGSGFSISYADRMGSDHIADGATSGPGQSDGSKGVDVVVDFVDYNSSHFGFRWGLAAELEMPGYTCKDQEADLDQISTPDQSLSSCNGKKDDPYAGTMYTKLQLGPLHLGTQATFKNPQNSGDSAVMNTRTFVVGGALVFGDTLSVSYGEAFDKRRYNDRNRGMAENFGRSRGAGQDNFLGPDANEYSTTKFRGYSAAINMGPVALKATRNAVDGMGENGHSDPRKHSEINLSIAF